MDTTTIASDTWRNPLTAASRQLPPVTPLDDLVEAALRACGATSGCACINEGGRVRLVAVAGDRVRLEAVAHDRSSPIHADLPSAVTVWCDAGAGDSRPARFHVVARAGDRCGDGTSILVVDARREPAAGMRRVLAVLAREAHATGDCAPSVPAAADGANSALALDVCVAEAREAEGRRVTAELHAMLGHELTSASLALSATLPWLDGAPACLDAVRAVAALLQGAVGRCRERMMAGYGPDAANEGFAATLRRLSATVARRGGVKVHVHVASGVPEQLTASSAYHLHHMAIDAIVGAVRHSQGSMVVVSIAADADTILLQVDEDGPGVPGHALHEQRRVESIESVAHMLGGDVRLRPRHPRGLSVRVRVPRAPGAALGRTVVRPRAAAVGKRVASR